MLILNSPSHGYSYSFGVSSKSSMLPVSRGKRTSIRRNIMEMQAEGDNIYTGVPGIASYGDVKFTIMGGGAFSLALAKVLSYKDIKTSLLVRDPNVAERINIDRYHPKYLTDCKVPDTVYATSDPIEGKLCCMLS